VILYSLVALISKFAISHSAFLWVSYYPQNNTIGILRIT